MGRNHPWVGLGAARWAKVWPESTEVMKGPFHYGGQPGKVGGRKKKMEG